MSMNIRAYALGIESYEDNRTVISMEEEAILVEGAAQDLADAQTTQAEVGRVEDIVDGLEDMAAIADQIETATPGDVAMVDTAQRIALAGSDVDSEEITPSIESYVGRTISTEGIKELASKLWDSLKRALKKVWAKIESFFYKVFGTLPNMRKSLEALKKRAAEQSGKTIKEGKTELGGEVNAVARNWVAPKKGKDLIDGFKTLNGILTYGFNKHHLKTGEVGGALADSLNDYDFDKSDESLGKIIAAISGCIEEKEDTKGFVLSNVTGDKRFTAGDAKKTEDLFGNKAVYQVGGKKFAEALVSSKASSLKGAELIRAFRLDVMMSADKDKDALTSGSIDTLIVAEVEEIATQCIEVLDLVEEYQRGKAKKEATKARERMETATDKLQAASKKREDMSAADIAYYRSAMNFNSWFLQTATQPNAALCSLALAAVRASVVICNKSLSNYSA